MLYCYLKPIIRQQLLLQHTERVITVINHGLRMRYQAMAEVELFASHSTERILCGDVMHRTEGVFVLCVDELISIVSKLSNYKTV